MSNELKNTSLSLSNFTQVEQEITKESPRYTGKFLKTIPNKTIIGNKLLLVISVCMNNKDKYGVDEYYSIKGTPAVFATVMNLKHKYKTITPLLPGILEAYNLMMAQGEATITPAIEIEAKNITAKWLKDNIMAAADLETYNRAEDKEDYLNHKEKYSKFREAAIRDIEIWIENYPKGITPLPKISFITCEQVFDTPGYKIIKKLIDETYSSSKEYKNEINKDANYYRERKIRDGKAVNPNNYQLESSKKASIEYRLIEMACFYAFPLNDELYTSLTYPSAPATSFIATDNLIFSKQLRRSGVEITMPDSNETKLLKVEGDYAWYGIKIYDSTKNKTSSPPSPPRTPKLPSVSSPELTDGQDLVSTIQEVLSSQKQTKKALAQLKQENAELKEELQKVRQNQVDMYDELAHRPQEAQPIEVYSEKIPDYCNLITNSITHCFGSFFNCLNPYYSKERDQGKKPQSHGKKPSQTIHRDGLYDPSKKQPVRRQLTYQETESQENTNSSLVKSMF